MISNRPNAESYFEAIKVFGLPKAMVASNQSMDYFDDDDIVQNLRDEEDVRRVVEQWSILEWSAGNWPVRSKPQFVKLTDPLGYYPYPPLDYVDTQELIIGEIKTSRRYALEEFDKCYSEGVAVPIWKKTHLEIATGYREVRKHLGRKHCFKHGWFTYGTKDPSSEYLLVYNLALSRINELMEERFSDDNGLRIRTIGRGNPDKAVMIPSGYWQKIGSTAQLYQPVVQCIL